MLLLVFSSRVVYFQKYVLILEKNDLFVSVSDLMLKPFKVSDFKLVKW